MKAAREATSIGEKLIELAFQADARCMRRYADVKQRIARDLVTYANAIMLDEAAVVVPEQRLARQRANRESATDLEVALNNLPAWYRWCLQWCSEKPLDASKNLLGLCNATTHEDAEECIANIKRLLRFEDPS